MRKILFCLLAVCVIVLAGKASYENWAKTASLAPADHKIDWDDATRERKRIDRFFASQSSGKLKYLSCRTGESVPGSSPQDVELLVPVKSGQGGELVKACKAIDQTIQDAHIADVRFCDSKSTQSQTFRTDSPVSSTIDIRFTLAELARHSADLAGMRNSCLSFCREEMEKQCRRHPESASLRLNWAVCSLAMNEPMDRQLESLERMKKDQAAPARARLAGELINILKDAGGNKALDPQRVAEQTAFLRQNLPEDLFSRALCVRLSEKSGSPAAKSTDKTIFDYVIFPFILIALMLAAAGASIAFRDHDVETSPGEEDAFAKRKGFPFFRLLFASIFSLATALFLVILLCVYGTISYPELPVMSQLLAYKHPVSEMLQETGAYLCALVPIIVWSYVFVGMRNPTEFTDFIHLKLSTVRRSFAQLVSTGLKFSMMDTAMMLSLVLCAALVVLPESASQDCFEVVVQTHRLPAILEGMFMMVVLAPLIEEILFRGLLYAGLRTHGCPVLPAILISAVIFAAAHGQFEWPAMLVRTASGIFFAMAFERTKSILPSMVAHGFHNLVVSLMYFI